jgi:hypothetical protein
MGVFDNIQAFDAFSRTDNEFRVRTKSGAISTGFFIQMLQICFFYKHHEEISAVIATGDLRRLVHIFIPSPALVGVILYCCIIVSFFATTVR